MNEFEQAAIKGVSDTVKDLVKLIIQKSFELGRNELEKLSIDMEYAYTKILERSYRSVHRIKTLANPSNPVSVEAVYVAPNLIVDKEKRASILFFDMIEQMKFVVITAKAGSGKSVFLRKLFIDYYTEAKGKIPVFIELRLIENHSTLFEYIMNHFNSLNQCFDNETFEYSLKKGKYILLLDGFDEIPYEMRQSRAKEITSLSFKFGDNFFIVSSRPDEIFDSWNEFYHMHIDELEKDQVLSLVKKIKFNKERKSAFIKRINETLYDTHKIYMSNPLLCTIMLLTFDQNAEIPSKMHTFFKMAFDALLFRHDTQKAGMYKRAYRTKLDAETFTSLCATFAVFSYIYFGSSMKREDALNCAKKSMEFEGLSRNQDEFIYDICTSLSIAIDEGGYISYIHRSFQEYLAATFLAEREVENWASLVEKLYREHERDSVVLLLSDINRTRFESQFLAPRLTKLITSIKKIDLDDDPIRMFNLFYLNITFNANHVDSWLIAENDIRPKWNYLLNLISKIYPLTALNELRPFNWQNFVTEKLQPSQYNFGEENLIEPQSMSNELIFDTPLHSYFKNLKTSLISLDVQIKSRIDERNKMISGALLVKPRRFINTDI